MHPVRTVALKDIVIIIVSEMIRERPTAAVTKGIINSSKQIEPICPSARMFYKRQLDKKRNFEVHVLLGDSKTSSSAKFCGSMALVAARTIPYFDKVCKWSHM